MESLKYRLFIVFIFSLMSLSLLAPLSAHMATPNTPDFVNHIALIVQAKLAILQGQFPLRMMPLAFSGLHYPYYQFYSPTSYLFSGLVYLWLTPSNPFIAYKVTIFLALLLGGIYLYRSALMLTKSKPAALLAAVVFYTMPYFNILVGHMAAFNELIALCLVQCLFFYTVKLYSREQKGKYFLLVSALIYLILTVHLITFVYSFLLISLFILLITCKNKRWDHGLKTGLAFVFGCLLAAWFLEPVILLSKAFDVFTSFSREALIYQSTPSLSSLLSPVLMNKLEEQHDIFQGAYQPLGIPIWVGVVTLIYLMNARAIDWRSKQGHYIFGLFVIFMLTFFLTWSPFNIWLWLPNCFAIMQYTMRGLGYLSWMGALLCAFSIIILFGRALDARYVVVGVLLLYAATNALLPSFSASPISITAIVNNPKLIFGEDAYLLNTIDYPQIVTQASIYDLETLIKDDRLKLNETFKIPHTIFGNAVNPMLSIKGNIIEQAEVGDYHLQLMTGASVFKEIALKPGPFTWEVPLNAVKYADILPIKFSLIKRKGSSPVVQATQVALTHLLPPTTLDYQQTRLFCEKNKELNCTISVPKQIDSLVLPFMYYPKMVHVTNNGIAVPAYGVLEGNLVLVGIKPIPGQINHIRVSFVGLKWANRVSQLSWGIWLLMLLYWIVIKRKRHSIKK